MTALFSPWYVSPSRSGSLGPCQHRHHARAPQPATWFPTGKNSGTNGSGALCLSGGVSGVSQKNGPHGGYIIGYSKEATDSHSWSTYKSDALAGVAQWSEHRPANKSAYYVCTFNFKFYSHYHHHHHYHHRHHRHHHHYDRHHHVFTIQSQPSWNVSLGGQAGKITRKKRVQSLLYIQHLNLLQHVFTTKCPGRKYKTVMGVGRRENFLCPGCWRFNIESTQSRCASRAGLSCSLLQTPAARPGPAKNQKGVPKA